MMFYQHNTAQGEEAQYVDLLHADHTTQRTLPDLDERISSYSVWPTPSPYTHDKQYGVKETGDYGDRSRFHSRAPEVWVRPMQRVVQLPPEWVGKGVRGYCMPTVNSEVSWIRNNDPDPWRVNTHEYFHFNYLGGGDGSEGFVHLLEHWRLGEDTSHKN